MPMTPIILNGGLDALNVRTQGNICYTQSVKPVSGALVPECSAEWQSFQVVMGDGAFLNLPTNHPEVSAGLRHSVVWSYRTLRVIGFTEQKCFPTIRVGTIETRMGLPRPEAPPSIQVGNPVCPQALTGDAIPGGKIAKGTTRSIRLAYRIGVAILPPSIAMSATANADGSMIKWTWRNLGSDQPIGAIVVFLGTGSGNEKRSFELDALATSWTDEGSMMPYGELASAYDQSENTAYIQTFVKRIGNYEFESGPSHPSAPTTGQSSRRLFFYKDKTLAAWGQEKSIPVASATFTVDPGGKQLQIDTISKNAAGGWILKTMLPHCFGDETLILSPVLKDYFRSLAMHFKVLDDNTLLMSQAPVKEIDPVLVRGAYIERSMSWDAAGVIPDTSAGLRFSGEGPHGMDAGQMVKVTGLDPADEVNRPWEGRLFRVYPTPDPNALVIMGPTRPDLSAWGGGMDPQGHYIRPKTGCTMTRQIFMITTPEKWSMGQDVVVTFHGKPYASSVLTKIKGGYLMECTDGEVPMPGSAEAGDGFSVVFNSHKVTHRRIYRMSKAGEWRLVAELPIWQEDYVDSMPSELLGDTPTSYFDNRIGSVVMCPPPSSMRNLTEHGGRHYGFHGNTIWWTEDGTLEGWSDIYTYTFPFRPLGMVPYAGRLVVLCENAAYMITGSTSDTQIVTMTDAIEGCVAPNSLCTVDGIVCYVSARGVVALSGGKSEAITTNILDREFWTRPGIMDSPDYAVQRCFLAPWSSSGYLNVNPDPPDTFSLRRARWSGGVIDSLFAVPYDGKMFVFWSNSDPLHQARESLFVDVRNGTVTACPIKPRHAAVDKRGQTWVLMAAIPGAGMGAFYPTFARENR